MAFRLDEVDEVWDCSWITPASQVYNDIAPPMHIQRLVPQHFAQADNAVFRVQLGQRHSGGVETFLREIGANVLSPPENLSFVRGKFFQDRHDLVIVDFP